MDVKQLLAQAVEAHVTGSTADAQALLKQAVATKSRQVAEAGSYKYSWTAKNLGEYAMYVTLPQETAGLAPGLYCVTEAEIEYSVLGKYYPATRYEPAEYPELEMGDNIVSVSVVPTDEDGDDIGPEQFVHAPEFLQLLPPEVYETVSNMLDEHWKNDTGPFGEEDPY